MADVVAGTVGINIVATSDAPKTLTETSAALGNVGKAADAAKAKALTAGQSLAAMGQAATMTASAGRTLGAVLEGNVSAALFSLPPLIMASAAAVKALGAALLSLATNPLVIMAAAVVAVIAVVVKAVSAYNDAQKAAAAWAEHQHKLNERIREMSLASAIEQAGDLAAEFRETGVLTDRMVLALDKLATEAGVTSAAYRGLAAATDSVGRLFGELGVASDDSVDRLRNMKGQIAVLREEEQLSAREAAALARALDDKLNAALGRTANAASKAKAGIKAAVPAPGVPGGIIPEGATTGFDFAALDAQAADERAYRQAMADMKMAADLANLERERGAEAASLIARENMQAEHSARMADIDRQSAAQRMGLLTDFASGAANAWAGMWEDVVTGQAMGGKKLLGQVLSLIGSLAIQLGTFAILSGTALSAIPFFGLSGGAAIGAGVALLAFGGALKGGGALLAGGSESAGSRGPLTAATERETGVRRPGDERGGASTININVNTGQSLDTKDSIALAMGEGIDRLVQLGYRPARAW